MEILLPHRVEYLVEGHVPIEDVIGSLQAQQRVVAAFGDLLGELLDGVTVEKAELRVRSISTGSLKEAFFVALFLVYQSELKKEVPAMIEKWLGLPVDDRYDTLVTVGVLLLLFYGADYAYKRYTDQLGSDRLRKQLDHFISELSHLSGKSEAEVRKIVETYFAKPSRLKEMGKAAIRSLGQAATRKTNLLLWATSKSTALWCAKCPIRSTWTTWIRTTTPFRYMELALSCEQRTTTMGAKGGEALFTRLARYASQCGSIPTFPKIFSGATMRFGRTFS